jgi:hypothetical protein
MTRIIAIVLGTILVLGATACGKETVIQERVVTVTASPSATPEASSTPYPDIEVAASGDVRACELVRLAMTREPNSPSWIDIMGDATFKAQDYDLQDAIDKAYWTSGDALAQQRTRDAEAICDSLDA